MFLDYGRYIFKSVGDLSFFATSLFVFFLLTFDLLLLTFVEVAAYV